MEINWYRSAASKNIKVLKPSAPKSIKPKKQKVFKGPKLPSAFKKRLYIPKVFVHSSLEHSASYMPDQSAAAIQRVYNMADAAGMDVTVNWVNETDSHRCDGNDHTRKTCEDLSSNPPSRDELVNGIWYCSHPDCDCHVNLELSNGQNYRISFDTMDIPELINQPEGEEASSDYGVPVINPWLD